MRRFRHCIGLSLDSVALWYMVWRRLCRVMSGCGCCRGGGGGSSSSSSSSSSSN